ncbi:uncharacterized protein LOC128989020 [Macrosteles quadrilineatus]|uniref:uncharacterized protein LOC128989020 n=1 Tax=Macrosteles quadrilineatus TaxID=74068 RepID=UPI0023E23D2C|nr:uncharacterized protein LOC128989020 [Macrosteles quadrilineatus]
MLKVNEPPISHENKEIDVLCFPDLYPEGKFGQFHSRETKLSSAEFIKCRLLSKHSQFRLNQQYLFYLLHDANLRQLRQGVFHKLNVTGFSGSLSARDCLNNLASGELEGNLTSVFSKLRNTSQYWIQPRNDVNCMAQHYGPATWFLTISPSDWNWDDMALFIREVNRSVPGAEKKQTSELVAMDPISASRFIHIKFKAMLDFIVSDAAPLGKVSHYFYRREYQSRGLQHFHLLLWVENAPVMGTSSNAEVADFILKYITCKVPNASVSPTLNNRVTSYQMHHHNSYCMRTKKTKTGFRKACRFGFPRPITGNLVLRDVVESVAGRKALKSKSRLYDLPRTPSESFVNDYNPAVLLAWNGNVDIQYVGESTSILHWYVTKYTTKSEQSHAGQVFTEINSTKSLASRLFNVGLRALNNRECGSLEASDTLLGIPLYGTDPETTIRWLDVGMTRRKRLQKIDKIRSMDPSSTNIFYESWVDDHYPTRPDELEDMNLYDFVRWYDIAAQPPKGDREVHKLNSGKFLTKRVRPCLLNHYKYSPTQDPEKYYHALLLMFLCWRSTDELKESHETYTDAFMAKRTLLTQAFNYDKRLKDIIAASENARDKIQNRVEEINAEEGEVADPSNIAFQPFNEPVPASQPVRDSNWSPNDEPFEKKYQKLNDDQKRVFDYVKRVVANSDGTDKFLRHFVSGVGGTGKSFLIKTISSWTKKCLQASTSISAPTGLSAYNINGSTIYKVFQLPVEHGKTPKYKALTDDVLKMLRSNLKDVVLFIIDEVSMVSNLTLMYINLRLCEIFNTSDQSNGWFGKKHILLFGDLLQLPPVHEDSPFIELDSSKLSSFVGSLSCVNIWSEQFSYDELTTNMRQAQDSKFADVLSKVRVGNMTVEDIRLIESKKIHLNGKTACENLSLLGDYFVCFTQQFCVSLFNWLPMLHNK